MTLVHVHFHAILMYFIDLYKKYNATTPPMHINIMLVRSMVFIKLPLVYFNKTKRAHAAVRGFIKNKRERGKKPRSERSRFNDQ